MSGRIVGCACSFMSGSCSFLSLNGGAELFGSRRSVMADIPVLQSLLGAPWPPASSAVLAFLDVQGVFVDRQHAASAELIARMVERGSDCDGQVAAHRGQRRQLGIGLDGQVAAHRGQRGQLGIGLDGQVPVQREV